MIDVPLTHLLILSAILYSLGVLCLTLRRHLIFSLIAVEVMLNAAALAFVSVGAHVGQPDGQIMFLLILTTAAAEVAVGLALAVRFHEMFHDLNLDHVNQTDKRNV